MIHKIIKTESATVYTSRELRFDELSADEQLQFLKDAKCKLVDSKTADAIVAVVGSDINQRNLTAKSVQLTLKVAKGTITDIEDTQLSTLDGLFAQVETLRADGNTKEAEIQACENVTALEAIEV